MIGTFPEAGLVVDGVERAVGMAAPMPLATLPVDKVGLDILPTLDGTLPRGFVAEMLVDVDPAHDVLGLYPPVQVVVLTAGVEVGLVDHGAVGVESFRRRLGHHPHDRLHFGQHVAVVKDQRGLVQEPRTLDVVAVALQLPGSARPVHIEKQVEVVGVGVQDAIGKDVDEVAQGAHYADNIFRRRGDGNGENGADGGDVVARIASLKLKEAAIEVGVRLDDVQMGVLQETWA